MANNFVPKICGDNGAYIPTAGCSDCDKLEARVDALEETRLVQSDILAGHNIEVTYAEDSNEVTVSSPNTYTKAEVNELIAGIQTGGYRLVEELPETGEPGYIYMVEQEGGGYEKYIWTEDGWADIGEETVTLDKQSILSALGYEETTISITDVNDNTVTKTVLIAIE